jgi:hypothetical protein
MTRPRPLLLIGEHRMAGIRVVGEFDWIDGTLYATEKVLFNAGFIRL